MPRGKLRAGNKPPKLRRQLSDEGKKLFAASISLDKAKKKSGSRKLTPSWEVARRLRNLYRGLCSDDYAYVGVTAAAANSCNSLSCKVGGCAS